MVFPLMSSDAMDRDKRKTMTISGQKRINNKHTHYQIFTRAVITKELVSQSLSSAKLNLERENDLTTLTFKRHHRQRSRGLTRSVLPSAGTY